MADQASSVSPQRITFGVDKSFRTGCTFGHSPGVPVESAQSPQPRMTMLYELCTQSDYDGLPEENDQKFVAFEAICRASLTRLITEDTAPHVDTLLQMQYMTEVAGAAEALGIDGIRYPHGLDEPALGLTAFMMDVSRETAKIKLAPRVASKVLSVRLGQKTRGQIEKQIQSLRAMVEAEVTPDSKKKSLLAKLDELSVELGQNRVSFAKVAIILAAVSTGLVNTTSFLANAPKAIATIHHLLGADKEAEDHEAQRLGAPPKPKGLLPKPDATRPNRQIESRMSDIIDEDIPF